MKLSLTIETRPQSFDAEDAISNILQDNGLREDLESIIEMKFEEMMSWRDRQQVNVQVSIQEHKG